MMDQLTTFSLLACYFVAIVVLCIYGMHRYWLVWLCLRHRGAVPVEPARHFEALPRVTVQLPMFNEPLVAERIIRAVCRLDYPHDRLQIQVLDDSTDKTAGIARRCCEEMVRSGHDVEYRHRSHRRGYKAGALGEGLESATGEFIALFDADFIPPREFLQRAIHHFTDASVGMVQARWSHLNRDETLLTRIQAMSLDAHFLIEQAARASTGRWFNFNGTAGMWRRACIDDAGGWQHDTLTEDTDLSYRAQLAGWRFRYLSHLCCPAEIPPTMRAVIGQQHRWNKGLIQTAIKLLPRILASDAPLRVKIESWFHLTAPLPYVCILFLSLLALPGIFTLPLEGVTAPLVLGVGLACLAMGTMAACVFYVVSQRVQSISLWRTVLRLPALMAIGVGISVINTKAVFEAILGRQSPFVRTPKFDGRLAGATDAADGTRRMKGLVELILGIVMIVCVIFALTRPFTLIGIPFLVLFGAGFFMVGVPLVRGSVGRGLGDTEAVVGRDGDGGPVRVKGRR